MSSTLSTMQQKYWPTHKPLLSSSTKGQGSQDNHQMKNKAANRRTKNLTLIFTKIPHRKIHQIMPNAAQIGESQQLIGNVKPLLRVIKKVSVKDTRPDRIHSKIMEPSSNSSPPLTPPVLFDGSINRNTGSNGKRKLPELAPGPPSSPEKATPAKIQKKNEGRQIPAPQPQHDFNAKLLLKRVASRTIRPRVRPQKRVESKFWKGARSLGEQKRCRAHCL